MVTLYYKITTEMLATANEKPEAVLKPLGAEFAFRRLASYSVGLSLPFLSAGNVSPYIKRVAKTAVHFLIVSAGICYAAPARAQLVDYGSIQALFGEPVTTSATGVPQRVSDVPVNMTIITADEIRQSGTRSIPQIIGLYVPGVDIMRGAENSYDVGIRGYQQPFQSGLLVLVDGRQVFVGDYSRTIWDNLPVNVDDVRQIEVVKGASSAFSSLYGSNAGYGVINIITYSPLYDKNNVANITVGTQNTISGDGTATLKGDGWGSKFTVGGFNADEFDTPRNAYDSTPFKPMHSYLVNSSVVQVSPTLQINTDANYSESRSNTADNVDGFIIGDQTTTSYSASAGFNWQSPYGVITNNNYINNNVSTIAESSDGGAPYNQSTQLYVSQLQDQFMIGTDHTFRIGMEYRFQTFSYSYAAELEPMSPKLNENDYSLNGMWLWQINDKLSLTNAIRLDSQRMYEAGQLWPLGEIPANEYTQNNFAWSGNSGIVYKVTDMDTIGASYGRGVLLPSGIAAGGNILQNFNSNFGAPVIDGEGNPYLKPTIVENYELNYTHNTPSIYSIVRVSPYYMHTKNIIDPYFTAGTPITEGANTFTPQLSENIGSSNGYGGEIEIKGSHEGFRWATSYSFAYVKDDSLVYANNDYQGSAPESHVRLLLGYTTGPWEFDCNGQYLSSTSILRDTGPDLGVVPVNIEGYYSVGGRIGYNINRASTL